MDKLFKMFPCELEIDFCQRADDLERSGNIPVERSQICRKAVRHAGGSGKSKVRPEGKSSTSKRDERWKILGERKGCPDLIITDGAQNAENPVDRICSARNAKSFLLRLARLIHIGISRSHIPSKAPEIWTARKPLRYCGRCRVSERNNRNRRICADVGRLLKKKLTLAQRGL